MGRFFGFPGNSADTPFPGAVADLRGDGGGYFGASPIPAVTPPPPHGSVTFNIAGGFNSQGPYTGGIPNTYNPGYGKSGDVPTGNGAGSIIPDPVRVKGARLLVFSIIGTPALPRFSICLEGALTQDWFINCTFNDGLGNLFDLHTDVAGYNTPWNDGSVTIWNWLGVHNGALLDQPITIHW